MLRFISYLLVVIKRIFMIARSDCPQINRGNIWHRNPSVVPITQSLNKAYRLFDEQRNGNEYCFTQKDYFLLYRNTYLFQNLTLWRGNVNALIKRSEQASDNTLQLETSDFETLFRTMIANTLKINPTNAKNAAKNPIIIRPDM